MSATTSVYVLTDGRNSKIGITNDLESRLQAYRTHNPDFRVHGVKSGLPIQVARRIEAIVKLCYKNVASNSGKEWFRTDPHEMMRLVDFHLTNSGTSSFGKEPLDIACGFVPVSPDVREMLSGKDVSHDEKERAADAFASAFNLGVPRHRLPEKLVMCEGSLPTDIVHCDRFAPLVRDRLESRMVGMPGDDHTYQFYRLIELKSGYFVALCTAHVSMPYLPAVSDMALVIDRAQSCGFQVFRHDAWSWWSPGHTGLLLYLQRTQITDRLATWDGSFRKWVIEHAKSLEIETGLVNTIQDIVHDSTFPTSVTCWTDLWVQYLKRFYRFSHSRRDDLKADYIRLFQMWRSAL